MKSRQTIDWKNIFALFGIFVLMMMIFSIGVLSARQSLNNQSKAAGIDSGTSVIKSGGNHDLPEPKPPAAQYKIQISNGEFPSTNRVINSYTLTSTSSPYGEVSGTYALFGGDPGHPLSLPCNHVGDTVQYQVTGTFTDHVDAYPVFGSATCVITNEVRGYAVLRYHSDPTCEGYCVLNSTSCRYGSGQGDCYEGFHCCADPPPPSPTPACVPMGQACSAECLYPNRCISGGYCCPPSGPEGSMNSGSLSQ